MDPFYSFILLWLLAVSKADFHTSRTSSFIFDSDDRVSLFHGLNFVLKSSPWYPDVLTEKENIQQMAEWGINTVRLGMMWSGAEPTEGEFNMTYYKIMGGIVDALSSHGIYTILDIHQDVLSSYFCLYDAAPKWVVDKSAVSKHSFPWPIKEGENGQACAPDRAWGKNYLAQATGVAFDGLFHNHNGMRDAFQNFVVFTANYFKDKDILGYEIMNEPWAGDIYSDPSLLLPGEAGSKSLQPFYDAIAPALHAADSKHLVFYEPVTWGMIFNGNLTGSGLNTVPGGVEYADSSVFSFHYYCWWLSDLNSDLQRTTCDRLFGPKVFEQATREVRHLGGAAMLTEWGQGCNYDAALSETEWNECVAIMDLADDHLMGWTDWYYGEHLTYSFTPSENAIAILARTYAKKIAGWPKEMKYNSLNKDFKLCFVPNIDPTAGKDASVTEVYANFGAYTGILVDVTENLIVSKIDSSTNTILVRNKPQVKPSVSLECITISNAA